jgi:hypothetical protein
LNDNENEEKEMKTVIKKKKHHEFDTSDLLSSRLTLKRLFDKNEEIWVKNMSHKLMHGGKSANVTLQVGTPPLIEPVVIPPGEDPVCLTDQADMPSLKTCRDLIKHVRSGCLELLDPKNAHVYYQQNKDRKKVVQRKIEDFLLRRAPLDTKPGVPRKVEGGPIQVNARIGDICQKSRHGIIGERDAIQTLMETEATITVDDCNYLLKNGVFKEVKRWASRRLDQLLDQATPRA